MDHRPLKPLLTTTDWNAEWMQLQQSRRKADIAAFWDEKAATYNCGKTHSSYATEFISQMGLRPRETVLDMGCGNGALAIPLADAGHSILACDFSQGMLSVLQKEANDKDLLDRITVNKMSWEDDWNAFNITENCVDVAIASRSIATSNLKDSLMRLNRTARRKACITLTTGASPRADERVLRQLGLQNVIGRDYLYAFNILAQEGLKPSVSYIESEKEDVFDTFEEAFASLSRMITDVTANLDQNQQEAALERLEQWLKDDLQPVDDGGQKRLRLSKPRCVIWAFISWNTR